MLLPDELDRLDAYRVVFALWLSDYESLREHTTELERIVELGRALHEEMKNLCTDSRSSTSTRNGTQ